MSAPQSKHLATELVKDSATTKEIPYKVLKAAPTVKYNITKRGIGNTVIFSFHNGNKNFPDGFQLYTNSGVLNKERREYVVRNADFPIKLTTFCSSNLNDSSSDMSPILNDFEIEFYEPGNWKISFVR